MFYWINWFYELFSSFEAETIKTNSYNKDLY